MAVEEDEDEDEDLDEDLEELSELDSDAEGLSDLLQSDSDEEEEEAEVTKVAAEPTITPEVDDGRKRKRRQRDEYDNLESKYLDRLANDDEPTVKRLKAEEKKGGAEEAQGTDASEDEDEDSVVEDAPPVHESLAADSAAVELEKANRTVFLSNVSFEAVTSGTAKKTLMRHLKSVLDKKAVPPQKVESIRFRSTAFSTAAMPKRAAYIKKNVMEATTKSTNAYVVYSSNAAARQAVAELNGTIVLERHIRVDSVAHPAPVDHKRCVFVGNLGFVDDESVLNTKVDENGKEITEKKKRGKVPMDVEEGLWRVFSKEGGKVESVRVVRDPITRVGKGIAYVQFTVSFPTGQPNPLPSPVTNPTPGCQLGRSRRPPQRQEVSPHAPPGAPREPLQSPAQDGPRHGGQAEEVRRRARPQARQEVQEGLVVRPQGHA